MVEESACEWLRFECPMVQAMGGLDEFRKSLGGITEDDLLLQFSDQIRDMKEADHLPLRSTVTLAALDATEEDNMVQSGDDVARITIRRYMSSFRISLLTLICTQWADARLAGQMGCSSD